jgi:hypothetical protein
MIRGRIWFRCAAMHDPVMPILVRPAAIGWKGKNRQIDLVIERDLTGAELLRRMKGWITVDPVEAIAVFEAYGRLKCFDDGELVVEVEKEADLESLRADVKAHFGDQCDIEAIPKNS